MERPDAKTDVPDWKRAKLDDSDGWSDSSDDGPPSSFQFDQSPITSSDESSTEADSSVNVTHTDLPSQPESSSPLKTEQLSHPSSVPQDLYFSQFSDSDDDADFSRLESPPTSRSASPPSFLAHQASPLSHTTDTTQLPESMPSIPHEHEIPAHLPLPRGVIIDPLSYVYGKLSYKPNNPAKMPIKIGPCYQVVNLPVLNDPDVVMPLTSNSLPFAPFTQGVLLPTTVLPLPSRESIRKSESPEPTPRQTRRSHFAFTEMPHEELVVSPYLVSAYDSEITDFLSALRSVCGNSGFSMEMALQVLKNHHYNFSNIRQAFADQDLRPYVHFFWLQLLWNSNRCMPVHSKVF
ncbi:hypothetical protein GEMRC1_003273 [Eukaryota sp. GEM-RC1]